MSPAEIVITVWLCGIPVTAALIWGAVASNRAAGVSDATFTPRHVLELALWSIFWPGLWIAFFVWRGGSKNQNGDEGS